MGRPQIIADSMSELGIVPEQLDCPCDFVDDSLAGSMMAAEQFEIVRLVEKSISVFVMDSFFGSERSSENFFHDPSVLKNDRSFATRVHEGGNRKRSVALLGDRPRDAFCNFAGESALVPESRSAFGAAQLPLSIYAASRFALNRHGFAALDAVNLPLVITKPHTFVRAFARAVRRVFTPSLSVGAQFASSFDDGGTARLTREAESFGFGYVAAMNLFVCTVAISTAKLSDFTRSGCEVFAAVYARLVNWHGSLLSVFVRIYDDNTPVNCEVNASLVGAI